MADPALGQGQISNGFALHATFMTLSWVTFAGIGQLSARYLKNALSKNGVWFKLHMAQTPQGTLGPKVIALQF